jgi:hypothetical protein
MFTKKKLVIKHKRMEDEDEEAGGVPAVSRYSVYLLS